MWGKVFPDRKWYFNQRDIKRPHFVVQRILIFVLVKFRYNFILRRLLFRLVFKQKNVLFKLAGGTPRYLRTDGEKRDKKEYFR